METHNQWMERALQLAEYGRGAVSPNPMVGCVIVHEGRIIGEGWHRAYGGPHAEVRAIEDATRKAIRFYCHKPRHMSRWNPARTRVKRPPARTCS